MFKCIVILFICTYRLTLAQFNGHVTDAPWCKGSIDLSNGITLEGFIQNNEKLRLIKFRPDFKSDVDARLVNEKDITAMGYYDSRNAAYRKFAFVNYRIHVSHESLNDKMKYLRFKSEVIEDSDLFEVITECKHFAVISKVSNTDFAFRMYEKGYLNPATAAVMKRRSPSKIKKKGLEYFEEFYIFDDSGNLSPVLTLNYIEGGSDELAKKNRKASLNHLLLKKYMEKYWKEVENYIDDNDLLVKTKSELLQLLNVYKGFEARGD